METSIAYLFDTKENGRMRRGRRKCVGGDARLLVSQEGMPLLFRNLRIVKRCFQLFKSSAFTNFEDVDTVAWSERVAGRST